jgi:hypothetical protein
MSIVFQSQTNSPLANIKRAARSQGTETNKPKSNSPKNVQSSRESGNPPNVIEGKKGLANWVLH